MKLSVITGWLFGVRNRRRYHTGVLVFAISLVVLPALGVLCHAQYSSRSSRRRTVQLSEPSMDGQMSLEKVFASRRETNEFVARPVTASQVGQLAWAAQGMAKTSASFETVPSIGVAGPMRLYFATHSGVFFYNPLAHSLEQSSDRDVRAMLAGSIRNRTTPVNAGCYVIIAGSVRNLTAQYGKKARNYMLFEAGRLARSIQLQAVTLKLGTLGVASFDTRAVATACRVDRKFDPAYMVCVGYPLIQEGPIEEEVVLARKVLMIIAASSFEDAELFETKFVLEQAGFETVVAGSVVGPVEGLRGGRAVSALLLSEVNVADYDAVVFVGGIGAHEYFTSPVAMKIARGAVESGKIVGAIGIAPRILANAGVLPGVNVTCHVKEQNRLKQAGAIYTGAPVERDGLIITARGAMAAVPFGRTIAEALRAGQQ